VTCTQEHAHATVTNATTPVTVSSAQQTLASTAKIHQAVCATTSTEESAVTTSAPAHAPVTSASDPRTGNAPSAPKTPTGTVACAPVTPPAAISLTEMDAACLTEIATATALTAALAHPQWTALNALIMPFVTTPDIASAIPTGRTTHSMAMPRAVPLTVEDATGSVPHVSAQPPLTASNAATTPTPTTLAPVSVTTDGQENTATPGLANAIVTASAVAWATATVTNVCPTHSV